MIVYKGHPEYEYVYRNWTRSAGASYGLLVGFNPGDDFTSTLPMHEQYPFKLDLQEVVIDGNGIDGAGVFHQGERLKSLAEITSNASDVLG